MMNCISIYLENGLIDMPLKNLDYRKLLDKIGNEMNIFFGGLYKNEYLNIKKTYDDLLDSFPELRKKNVSQTLMTRNLNKYCQFHDFEFENVYSGGVGKMIIKDNKQEFKPLEEAPF
jgi:hypothetical protein